MSAPPIAAVRRLRAARIAAALTLRTLIDGKRLIARRMARLAFLSCAGWLRDVMKFFHLNFLPRSADLGLLALRLSFGLSLLLLHGWGKLMTFSEMRSKFPDPLGIGHTPSLVLAIAGEVVCSTLVVIGAFTRFAAIGSLITMGVAFYFVHGAKLAGTGNGEMAFLYGCAFLVLFFAGAGRFSLDAKMGAKS